MDKGKPYIKHMYRRTMTLNEFVDNLNFGCFSLKLVAVTGFLMFVYGVEVTPWLIVSPTYLCTSVWPVRITHEHIPFFVGMAIGAVYWGWMADKWGRKNILMASSAMVLYYTMLDTIPTDDTCRIFVKLFIGVSLSATIVVVPCYLVEYNAIQHRGRITLAVKLFIVLGGFYCFMISYLTENRKNAWRYYRTFTILPLPLAFVLLLWLPESMHYLRHSGKYEQFMNTLHYVSSQTNTMLPGSLKIDCSQSPQLGALSVLAWPQYNLKITLMVLVSMIAASSREVAVHLTKKYFVDLWNMRDCTILTYDNRLLLFSFATAAAGIFFATLLLEVLGRRNCLMASLSVTAVCFVALGCHLPFEAAVALLFVLRGLTSVTVHIIYLYAAELFPTVVRASSLGICVFAGSLAEIPTPFVVKLLLPLAILALGCIYAGLSILAALIMLLLPDTTGQTLVNI